MKKNTLKMIKFPFIMSIITFVIGILLSSNIIGYPIQTKIIILLASFIPFIAFLIIISIILIFKEKTKVVFAFKIVSIIISSLLLFYYFIALFVIIILEATHPITNPKYYSEYVSGHQLRKVFPKKIPDNVENIDFFYVPGILQGATTHSLYYIDKKMTLDKFNKEYKDKAIWIGYINEYTEKKGLLVDAINPPTQDKNVDDFIIYLIEGECDNSGYCNHGNFLIAAYNEKTNEVIFKSQTW